MQMQVIASPVEKPDEAALAQGVRLTCRPKTVFYQQHEKAEKAYYLEKGLVKFTSLGPDGTQKTLCYVEDGNIFGELGLVKNKSYGATAIAVMDCQVICFTREQFWKFVNGDIGFAELCIGSLAEKLWSMGKQYSAICFYDRFGKVASGLIYLGKRWGEIINVTDGAGDRQAKAIKLRITHQELAEFTGTSRVSVTNVLDAFEAKKIIRKKNREIVIMDPQELERWAR
ncbi:MAG: Crp/Fnr family transcriptional regulator [Clostridia bacterium]|nr:MAG: Crp/Fnr family transcriptional regulator [Clostridia bacterium]